MKQSEINALNILNNISEDSTADLLEKSMGHKYFKREGTPGNYKYYYTEAEYKQAKGKKSEENKENKSPETIEKDGKKYKLQSNGKYLEVSDQHLTKADYERLYKEYKSVIVHFEDENVKMDKQAYMRARDIVTDSKHYISKLSDKEFTKEELKEDKKNLAKEKLKLSPQVERVIDALTTVNSKYNEPSKITVETTPKGNWRVYYEGKETGITLGRNQISEDTIRDNQWEHHEK